jgi:hypothetical protein
MIVRRTIGIATLLLGVAGVTASPVFASGEQPGGQCSPGGIVSSDGTLVCSGQSGMWMARGANGGLLTVKPGQPCDRPGDVAYTPPEDIVHCRQGTWQR